MNPSDPRDAPVPDALTIDCASCAMQHSDACDDCVVTFICSRDADDAVVIGVCLLYTSPSPRD